MRLSVISATLLLMLVSVGPAAAETPVLQLWSAGADEADGAGSSVTISDGWYQDIRGEDYTVDVTFDPCGITNPLPSGGVVGVVGNATWSVYQPTCVVVFDVADIVVVLAGQLIQTGIDLVFLVTDLVVGFALQVADLAQDLADALIAAVLAMVDPVIVFVDGVVATTCDTLIGDPTCGIPSDPVGTVHQTCAYVFGTNSCKDVATHTVAFVCHAATGTPDCQVYLMPLVRQAVAYVCNVATGNPQCQASPPAISVQYLCNKFTGDPTCHLDVIIVPAPQPQPGPVLDLSEVIRIDADCGTC